MPRNDKEANGILVAIFRTVLALTLPVIGVLTGSPPDLTPARLPGDYPVVTVAP